VIGSVGGNLVLFLGSAYGRRRFFAPATELPPGRRRKFQEWFRRYGLLTVFVPAVTPILPLPLKVFVISAGALHTRFSRFLMVILAARLIRYFGEAWLGIRLGADAQGFLQRNAWTLIGAVLAVAFALYFAMRFKDRRRAA
jgi:membrane protein YqaA with SNARE-associated domain